MWKADWHVRHHEILEILLEGGNAVKFIGYSMRCLYLMADHRVMQSVASPTHSDTDRSLV